MSHINNLVCGASSAGANLAISGGYSEWIGLAGLALLASVFMLAFIYILGTIMKNQNLLAFVKFELYEAIVSAVIIGVLFALVAPLCSLTLDFFVPATSHNAGKTLFVGAEDYFTTVGKKMAGWFQANYLINIYVDQIASVTPYSRPLSVGLVATPLAGLGSPLKQMLYNVSTALSIAYLINWAQLFVLHIGVVGFLKYYLPAGIFLRTFTPTRRIGGALIALSIGFLFIYPVLSVITSEMLLGQQGMLVTFSDILSDTVEKDILKSKIAVVDCRINPADSACTDCSVVPAPPGACLPTDNSAPCVCQKIKEERDKTLFTGFSDSVKELTTNYLGKTFSFITGGFLTTLLLLPLSTVGMAFAVGYLLPAFNTLILIHSVKSISKTIGEEIDIATLTRLV